MHSDADPFRFPELPDDAVIALNDFLEQLYTDFQNHYFAQMHRHDADRDEPHRYNDQLSLPLHPPF
jgi:hypothetical protein